MSTSIWFEPYLEKGPLDNLRLYRYSSIDLSPITRYILRHWWDLAARAFPIWMAPNLITLAGLGFILLNVACLVVYIPDLIGPAPSWIYYTFALGLFLYQTFDNVDGRQARRTKTSSALGHIFDHTIDSLNCPLGGLIQVATVGLGSTKQGLFILLVGCGPMWFSTWEEYHTGTLFLGYINGPTEGLLIAMAVQIVSGYFGAEIWKQSVQSTLGLHWIPQAITFTDIYLTTVFLAFIVVHIPACLYNVHKARRAKGLSLRSTLAEHIPYLTFNALVCLWLLSPYSNILANDNNPAKGQHSYLIEFAILVTFAFGKLGPRVILAHLTHSPFPWWNYGAFLPLLGGAILANLPYLGITRFTTPELERTFLYNGIVFASMQFVQWATLLCLKFAMTLNVGILTIPKAKQQ